MANSSDIPLYQVSWLGHRAPTSAREIAVSADCRLRDAVRAINIGPAHVALVIAGDGRLLGTLTDGDVRRGLLEDLELDSPAIDAMPETFQSLHESATAHDALVLMRSHHLHQVPVVDDRGRISGIYVLDENHAHGNLGNTVVIMAGGEGLRLRPLTKETPKALLPVGDRPMLEIIIRQCAEAGLREFVISVNYLKNQIKEFVGDGSKFGVHVSYIEESNPTGTAGSLSLLSDLGTDPFIVINGDVLTRINFRHLLSSHTELEADATVCARRHETPVPFGILHTDGLEIVGIDEKPMLSHLVNAGIYVLQPSMIDLIPLNAYLDMTDLLKIALSTGRRIKAFPLHEYWLDIGRPENLQQAGVEWID